MAHMNYGCMHPSPKTTEYPVAADQFFSHIGPNLVNITTGYITLAETADTTIFGVAVVPKGRGNPANTSDLYWKSNGTSGVDKIPIIKVDSGYNFLFLADDTPTASQAGNACDLTAANAAGVDYVDIGNSTNDIFIIQGRGVDYNADAGANDVVVKLNREVRQGD